MLIPPPPLPRSQDPTECLISFICSSNNNISRITQMLGRLRTRFGQHLATVGGDSYHAFPSVDALTAVREQQLRDMGFGYRARFVCETVAALKVSPCCPPPSRSV